MPRNIDMTALRSFVTVADTGGVTRAAAALNLTQSAVSMQLKRLEESLGQTLLDRTGRGIGLTSAGEQVLSYGRKLLILNDEIYSRMTDDAYEGVLVLGVPHDIVYPAIPRVLKLFKAEHPRMRLQLLSSATVKLKEMFANGECDIILTTERSCGPDGEVLAEKPLVWFGAHGGTAWQQRPLPIASEPLCTFRRSMQVALDTADIAWEMAVDSDSTSTVTATTSADFAVLAMLAGTAPPQLEQVPHQGQLPDLGTFNINLFQTEAQKGQVLTDLADLIRQAYRAPQLALTA
ncbi:MAG: LysR family transcriptional regulator [Pseudomonadota bacterium]